MSGEGRESYARQAGPALPPVFIVSLLPLWEKVPEGRVRGSNWP